MKRLTVMLAGVVLTLGLGAVVGAQPANAWTWSSQVTLSGNLNQCGGGGPQTADVDASFNNQRVVYGTGLGMPPRYSVTFTNVPGGFGGWAWIVINCRVTGSPHGYWVHVYRPGFGSTLAVNL